MIQGARDAGHRNKERQNVGKREKERERGREGEMWRENYSM